MAKHIETNKMVKVKVKRKGRHAKTKMSSLKSSKNYTKKYKGQG
jgi:hypothetical protein